VKKLVSGIVDFRNNVLPTCREKFAKLANDQRPDSLFITCSDSRVAPNWFASTDPGDLFVIRNVGNLIPPHRQSASTLGDASELAAVEFAIQNLYVSDIIICGHSDCGAMDAIANGNDLKDSPHLESWLRNGHNSLKKLGLGESLDLSLSRVNQLSQLNALQQIENLKTYPLVANKLRENKVRLHAWWFDIAKADIYRFDERAHKFVLIVN